MAKNVATLLEEFIALYTRDTLPHWRTLFLPGFMAAATNDDGSVTTWNLDQFYERQQTLFASGKPIREVLQNTETRVDGRLAFVRSEFVWTDGEVRRRGRLMMLIAVEHDEPKVQALTFSYAG